MIYHRIYGKIWHQVFLTHGCIWLFKLKKVEGSVWVEFSDLSSDDIKIGEWVIKIGDFILTGYYTGFAQGVAALEKKLVIIQDLLNFILFGLWSTLVSSGDGSFCLLPFIPFWKYRNDETWQGKWSVLIRSFKYHKHVFVDVSKNLEISLLYKMILAFKFKMQFSFRFHRIKAK